MGVSKNLRDKAIARRLAMACGATAAAAILLQGGAAKAAQQIGDVFYIALENHNFTQPNANVSNSSSTIEQIQGNPAAPFINSLITPGNPNAANVSYATNYHNVLSTPSGNNPSIHPSEPNYVWMEAGSNLGITNDDDPYTPGNTNVFSSQNLSGLLQAKGISWKSYQEDVDLTPSSGSVNQPAANSLTSTVASQSQWTVPINSFSGTSSSYTNAYNGSHQYNYAVKHNPMAFFTSTNGGTTSAGNTSPSNPESSHYSPLQQLQTDLNNNTVGRYNWITPDQYNDMHTALSTSFTYNGVTYAANTDAEQIALGDNFLSIIVPEIEASQAFKNNGVIVIWNDETEAQNSTDTTENDFSHTSTEIVISPLAKGNAFASTVNYTHSSDVKTLQEIFDTPASGGPFLGDANTAGINDLSDMFQSGVIPAASSVPLPPAAYMGGGVIGLLGLTILRRRKAKSA